MIGFSFANSFWILVVLTVPYGLGAGGVDATLNNFVALHYKSRHMSWLHCFWGVGAMISPYIMGYSIGTTAGWHGGYRIVGLIQVVLAVALFISLPLWKKVDVKVERTETVKNENLTLKQIFSIKGVLVWLMGFFCYCALEQTMMLWSGTYFAQYKLIDSGKAAFYSSFVFIGITAGRLVSGFVAEKLGDKRLIRIGYSVILAGLVLVAIPVKSVIPSVIGFTVAGVGCAPVYPSIIHATPDNFGREKSQAIIGVQMAFAYTGITLMPPLFGLIAQNVNVGFLPLYVFAFTALLIVCCEVYYAKKSEKRILIF
jgi:fucose permease